MSGIVFFKTQQLARIREFYNKQIGMDVWLEQADCVILQHGNLLVGFCTRDTTDICGVITIYYQTKNEVDEKYERFKAIALAPPKINEKYDIYHFFIKDPDDRFVEFQQFLNPI